MAVNKDVLSEREMALMLAFLKYPDLTRSVAKWLAIAALPPFPTKKMIPPDREHLSILSMAASSAFESIDAAIDWTSFR